ncbi:MAG: hypothetical protein A4E70_01392 [Syntrophus sp. PtaU1.Bin005]|jgi:hypothetical protein|uniref:VPLPA-CTERM sorting domain-containing protein n=1 Tax=Syntrophus TaxID=43773 RepID=UPI0009D4ECA6|nr:MAG: hypothetical protein A4E69_03397 [Syntrophus sp. PtaB.Bin138]OPY81216.1 MAG: hypothetical protein A4E70_01392 [Syntrophus sp. PtaU1.Bin005]
MNRKRLFAGFSKKLTLIACLLALLLFASNASAYLSSYSFNLIYASKDLNGGMMDDYAKVTVNLQAIDEATIVVEALNGYRLQNRLGVQLNAFLFSTSNLSAGELAKGEEKNFSEFGEFNAAFSKLGKLDSFSFDVTNTTVNSDWTDAKEVLHINDQGYLAAAHIVPENGESGYAAGDGKAVVPLPGAVWLLGSGLVGLAAFRRRKA